jgi:hypothetical protein
MGLPVEVQVRTPLQDLWAQITERLGDAWGRGLRYGAPIDNPDGLIVAGDDLRRKDLLERLQDASEMIDLLESIEADLVDIKRRTPPELDQELPTSAQLEAAEASLRSWLASLERVVIEVEGTI